MRCQPGALLSREPSFSAEQPLLTGSGLLLSRTTCVNSHFGFIEVIRGKRKQNPCKIFLGGSRNGDVTVVHMRLEVA